MKRICSFILLARKIITKHGAPGMTKGVPGDFIVFCDKNGNKIQSFRYEKQTAKVTVAYGNAQENKPKITARLANQEDARKLANFPLDLSIVNQGK